MSIAQSTILAGSLGSLLAGLATAVGALPILFIGRPTDKQQNLMLGFAAGVMLAASFFSLIIPGLAQAQAQGWSKPGASALVVGAILIGAAVLSQLNHIVPPLDELGLGPSGIAQARFRRIWLFVVAITLHNFPEGLAVGVSFGGGNIGAGISTAVGIGLQNMPEGLAVAGSLASLGYSRRSAIGWALASGLVEPVAGVFGAVIVTLAQTLLPWGLGFAAGAMIYVVASEIIPDTHSRLQGSRASLGLMVGLGLMLMLDTTLA
ncbi:ZIP family metal transporter [uncultured Sphingomonas sp.]|uniref:ZIP family metal transporter n=1 Tax=uncultured Sphingomonas sp. TaxID=158754 RepID=UPI0025E76D3B|nr:ZIP family metal transporter [uncultured Sphingomonas sp.]